MSFLLLLLSLFVAKISFAQTPVTQPSLIGSASCSAASCHGGTQPKKDEFTTWATKDKHSRAYGVLFDERSRKMAKILKLKSPAHEDQFCLSCHSVSPSFSKSPKFDVQEGVSCESCHGAASVWLEPHTRHGWTHTQSIALGMTDLKNMQIRAEKCLNCHSGVDHTLLSAGHPDVTFELDTFSAVMPKHWKEKEKWASAKAWAVGQVVQLRNTMKHLKENTEKTGRLDESFRNCFACHHDIYDVKWTLADDATGSALWDPSRYVVFHHLLLKSFVEEEKEISDKMSILETAFSKEKPELSQVAEAAGFLENKLNDLIPKIHALSFETALIRSLLASISGDSGLSQKGFRTAEQTLMALDALSLSLQDAGVLQPAVRLQIKKLYDVLDVKDPAHYDPSVFGREMENFNRLFSHPASKSRLVNPKGWWGKF